MGKYNQSKTACIVVSISCNFSDLSAITTNYFKQKPQTTILFYEFLTVFFLITLIEFVTLISNSPFPQQSC